MEYWCEELYTCIQLVADVVYRASVLCSFKTILEPHCCFRLRSAQVNLPENDCTTSGLLTCDLQLYIKNLQERLEENFLDQPFYLLHNSLSFKSATQEWSQIGQLCAEDVLGFSLVRKASSIKEAGTGVFVRHGYVPKNSFVAFYPGIPILLIFLSVCFVVTVSIILKIL